jgi:hypothetical protein
VRIRATAATLQPLLRLAYIVPQNAESRNPDQAVNRAAAKLKITLEWLAADMAIRRY